jgi:hypothetical protein
MGSPGQPRDDHGMWSSGGGVGPRTSGTAGRSPGKTDQMKHGFSVNPKTGPTPQQREAAAREMFGSGPRPKR